MNQEFLRLVVGVATLSSVSVAVAQTAPVAPEQEGAAGAPNAGEAPSEAEAAEPGNEERSDGDGVNEVESRGETFGGEADGEYAGREPAVPDVDPGTPAGRFGASSQLAISSDAGLFIANTSLSGDDDSGSTTTLQLRPAFDYFIIDNLSIGGFVGLDYVKVPAGDSTTWGIGPRIGYNIPFSDRFSVWPKVGFSFASTSTSTDVEDPLVDGDANSSNLALNLFAPVMFHPVEHFFLGFGPALDTDLSGDVKATTIAGRLTIGGWLR